MAEKCRGNYQWDFLHYQCVYVCLALSALYLSCQNTLQCVSLTSTEVLCTSMSERGVSVFQLATAVLQNALRIPRLLKELHQPGDPLPKLLVTCLHDPTSLVS